MGMMRFREQDVISPYSVVLREPDVHVSCTNLWERVCSMRSFGSFPEVARWYRTLPELVHFLVNSRGFGLFSAALGDAGVNHDHIAALMERWWDTTKSFHS
ncbi:hypothetical protein CsSME_00007920 [Camellia sinensis var. sinensis]